MHTSRLGLVLAASLLCPLGVACSATTSSTNIRTAGMVALIDVTSEREGSSVVTTSIVVGGQNSNTHVVLEGKDHLVAVAGKDHKPMQAVGTGDYEAKFDASTGEFEVRLGRDGDKAAHDNKGTMPPPFEIISKFDQKPISRKSKIVLEWSPVEGGAEVTIHVSGDCILDQDFNVGGDPGRYEIPGKTIEAWESKKKEACNVSAVITRTTRGSTDKELDSDSRFLLHQVRTATFVSGP
jgi:hypothetical protein